MSMDHFKQTAGFTSWDEYKQDEPIESFTLNSKLFNELRKKHNV